MNRVIKIRAFNTIAGRMSTNYEIQELEKIEGKTQWQNLKVMLWSGLLDKNGKEIYEGDIYAAHGHKYTVFYKNGAFCGGKSIEQCSPIGWEPEEGTEEEYTGDLSISFFCSEIEVIGNMYEKEC